MMQIPPLTHHSFEPWHFHVYYDEKTRPIAEEVVRQAGDLFNIEVGSFHDQPVGPHPIGSCQLTVSKDAFALVLNWLALNRQGLTVFCHPDTGDVMADHSEHTLWLGSMPKLNLDVLERFLANRGG